VPLAPGEGKLEVLPGGRVAELAARPPLSLLQPKNHGHGAWIFVGNLGGGLVGGDVLSLEARLAPGATAFFSTQASTKVYPSDTPSAQVMRIAVGEGATLVSIPDPVVAFAGARYRQDTAISLARGAKLVWLEAFAGGRVESGERWAFARAESRLSIAREDRPWLDDAWLLDPAHGGLAERFGRFHAIATLVVVGTTLPVIGSTQDAIAAASPLGDDAHIVRFAAVSTQFLTAHLRAWLTPIAGLLGDDPFARKW
jgi:urease accessory protein